MRGGARRTSGGIRFRSSGRPCNSVSPSVAFRTRSWSQPFPSFHVDLLEREEREQSSKEAEQAQQRQVEEAQRRSTELERIAFEDAVRVLEEKLWNEGKYD